MYERALCLLLCQGTGQARQAATLGSEAQAQEGSSRVAHLMLILACGILAIHQPGLKSLDQTTVPFCQCPPNYHPIFTTSMYPFLPNFSGAMFTRVLEAL